ncbi:hypothetical protein SCHPADRAFT_512905 [Schizopora paradoxa]|uniref:Uncharacterized protein n=1 Tax=Schizopora paradoxa TaxID=27342 RepID=A0A0H2RFB2_9AGAM|nr:hypothetical protein SCHPADRAFT_512905 [Schizopora paradoxa]
MIRSTPSILLRRPICLCEGWRLACWWRPPSARAPSQCFPLLPVHLRGSRTQSVVAVATWYRRKTRLLARHKRNAFSRSHSFRQVYSRTTHPFVFQASTRVGARASLGDAFVRTESTDPSTVAVTLGFSRGRKPAIFWYRHREESPISLTGSAARIWSSGSGKT